MKKPLLLLAALVLPATFQLHAQVLLDFTSGDLASRQANFDANFYRSSGGNFSNAYSNGVLGGSSIRAVFGAPNENVDGRYNSGNTHYLNETIEVGYVTPTQRNGASGGVGIYTRIQTDTNLGIYGMARVIGENSVALTLRYGANITDTSGPTNSGTAFYDETAITTETLGGQTSFFVQLLQGGGTDPSFTLSLLSSTGDVLATTGNVVLSQVAGQEIADTYAQPGAIGFHYYAGTHPARFSTFEVIPEASASLLFFGAAAIAAFSARNKKSAE